MGKDDDQMLRLCLVAVFSIAIISIVSLVLLVKSGPRLPWDASFAAEDENIAGQAFAGCSDNDGGLNYFVRGVAYRNGFAYGDYCLLSNSGSTILQEYYCSSGVLSSKQYTCPYKCSLGRCV
jgi:hypothetical protein